MSGLRVTSWRVIRLSQKSIILYKKYFMLELIDGKFDVTAFLAQFNTEELGAFGVDELRHNASWHQIPLI